MESRSGVRVCHCEVLQKRKCHKLKTQKINQKYKCTSNPTNESLGELQWHLLWKHDVKGPVAIVIAALLQPLKQIFLFEAQTALVVCVHGQQAACHAFHVVTQEPREHTNPLVVDFFRNEACHWGIPICKVWQLVRLAPTFGNNGFLEIHHFCNVHFGPAWGPCNQMNVRWHKGLGSLHTSPSPVQPPFMFRLFSSLLNAAAFAAPCFVHCLVILQLLLHKLPLVQSQTELGLSCHSNWLVEIELLTKAPQDRHISLHIEVAALIHQNHVNLVFHFAISFTKWIKPKLFDFGFSHRNLAHQFLPQMPTNCGFQRGLLHCCHIWLFGGSKWTTMFALNPWYAKGHSLLTCPAMTEFNLFGQKTLFG